MKEGGREGSNRFREKSRVLTFATAGDRGKQNRGGSGYITGRKGRTLYAINRYPRETVSRLYKQVPARARLPRCGRVPPAA